MIPEIICIGMGTVDLMAQGVGEVKLDGSTFFVDSAGMKTGGDATNESITLHKVGHEVALVTAVGNDDAGKFYKMKVAESGVATDGIAVSEEYPTATSIVLIGKDGERSFLALENNAASTMRFLLPEGVEIGKGLKAISLASLFYTKGQKDEDMAALLKQAREAGAVTFADLVMDLKDLTLDDIKETLSYLDYVVPSYDEAVYYTKKTDPKEITEVLRSYGAKNVIIKMGAKGVYASQNGQELMVPTIAEKVVDTTGAGDNFMAGFISGIVQGMNLEEALYFGSATSAISISQIGATGAVKSREQVEEYLEKHRA